MILMALMTSRGGWCSQREEWAAVSAVSAWHCLARLPSCTVEISEKDRQQPCQGLKTSTQFRRDVLFLVIIMGMIHFPSLGHLMATTFLVTSLNVIDSLSYFGFYIEQQQWVHKKVKNGHDQQIPIKKASLKRFAIHSGFDYSSTASLVG